MARDQSMPEEDLLDVAASDDDAVQTGKAADIRSLIGCLPGEPSLADALLAERKTDREREERRFDELMGLRRPQIC